MDEFHIYEVGMGSDKQKIKAQSAAAAAMYYSLFCVRTNNPFMTAVYTEDGEQWNGHAYWISVVPTFDHAAKVIESLAEQIKAAEKVSEADGR